MAGDGEYHRGYENKHSSHGLTSHECASKMRITIANPAIINCWGCSQSRKGNKLIESETQTQYNEVWFGSIRFRPNFIRSDIWVQNNSVGRHISQQFEFQTCQLGESWEFRTARGTKGRFRKKGDFSAFSQLWCIFICNYRSGETTQRSWHHWFEINFFTVQSDHTAQPKREGDARAGAKSRHSFLIFELCV